VPGRALGDACKRTGYRLTNHYWSDVYRYALPPDFTKHTDSRRAAFVAKYGDVSVELDALPATVLRDRLMEEVEALIDIDALEAVRALEERERLQLVTALSGVSQ
jgi:hypothetical protein